MIKTIPLSKLVASPRNVRRSSDPRADAELKADIEARGLIQNLVVASAGKPRGCFSVEAGERRRRALQGLADEGKLAKDHEVCCLVINRSDAGETSLAENFQRLAMNPADECLAFQQLVERGANPEAIARRFGLTVRFVEGRLRLAGLAPIVFEALGAGEISLDVAKAYAATPDRERQAHVFEQSARSYMGDHPDSIRRLMTQATIGAGDRRALLVGEEAYLAAGGRIERDLFCEEEDARWLDVALLERLAIEKMETLAAELKMVEGLAFVTPILDSWVGWGATEGLRRVELEAQLLSDEEKDWAGELEAGIEGLSGLLEDEELGETERSEAETKLRELGTSHEAILDKPPLIPDEMKGKIGTFLLLDGEGHPRFHNVFYAPASAEPAEAGPGVGGEADSGQTPAQPRGLPRRLADELAIQRRDILAVHLAADPGFALDLAAFLMADRSRGYSSGRSGSSLSANPPADPLAGFETPEARATIAAAQAFEGLERGWTEKASTAERFDAFRCLPADARAGWLGHSLARTLEASANLPGERKCAFHDHLGSLLSIDVASWWRPTGRNFFDRVPKSMMLDALREVGGPELAQTYAKSRKAELAQACERVFSGDFIAAAEAKQAALAWLPEAMRFAPPDPGEAPAGGTSDTSDTGDAGDTGDTGGTGDCGIAPWEEEPAVSSQSAGELGEAA